MLPIKDDGPLNENKTHNESENANAYKISFSFLKCKK